MLFATSITFIAPGHATRRARRAAGRSPAANHSHWRSSRDTLFTVQCSSVFTLTRGASREASNADAAPASTRQYSNVLYCTVLYISMHSAVYSTMRARAAGCRELSGREVGGRRADRAADMSAAETTLGVASRRRRHTSSGVRRPPRVASRLVASSSALALLFCSLSSVLFCSLVPAAANALWEARGAALALRYVHSRVQCSRVCVH